jgi:hypothetical protein
VHDAEIDMPKTLRFLLAALVAGAMAAGPARSALAADGSSDFGQHVAMCAQMSLGDRVNPPEVSCTHDGMTMTFANSGEVVQHMRAMSR